MLAEVGELALGEAGAELFADIAIPQHLASARAVAPETFEVHDWSSWAAQRVEDGQPKVQAVQFQIRVPEIVLLLVYDRIPRKRCTIA